MNSLASGHSLASLLELLTKSGSDRIGSDRIGSDWKNLDRIGLDQRNLDRIAKSRVALNSRQKLSRGYLDQDGGKSSKS